MYHERVVERSPVLSDPNPQREGIDHINAYSRSRTELGRLISNFAHTPFVLPTDGPFASIEAYWYWLSVREDRREQLRPLHGYGAKKRGRLLQGRDWPRDPMFEPKIKVALVAKVTAHPRIQELLISSGALPIVHYYAEPDGIRMLQDGLWIWAWYEEVRKVLQA